MGLVSKAFGALGEGLIYEAPCWQPQQMKEMCTMAQRRCVGKGMCAISARRLGRTAPRGLVALAGIVFGAVLAGRAALR